MISINHLSVLLISFSQVSTDHKVIPPASDIQSTIAAVHDKIWPNSPIKEIKKQSENSNNNTSIWTVVTLDSKIEYHLQQDRAISIYATIKQETKTLAGSSKVDIYFLDHNLQPIQDAGILIDESADCYTGRMKTDALGHASRELLPPGNYTFNCGSGKSFTPAFGTLLHIKILESSKCIIAVLPPSK